MTNRVFLVDVEATSRTPFSGVMTEFGLVEVESGEWFHGVLHPSMPSPSGPGFPVLSGQGTPTTASGSRGAEVASVKPVKATRTQVLLRAAEFINGFGDQRPVLVSRQSGHDYMFLAYHWDKAGVANPFEHIQVAVAAESTATHYVDYRTRYGETSGLCHCSATMGRDHHERDSAWLSAAQEQALTPEQRAEARQAYRAAVEDDD